MLQFRNQYDSDVTVWSPAGRLHQVEYAMEAVKQGSATVGLKSKTDAVIVALKRASSDLAAHQKKVIAVDEHMGVSISGKLVSFKKFRQSQSHFPEFSSLIPLCFMHHRTHCRCSAFGSIHANRVLKLSVCPWCTASAEPPYDNDGEQDANVNTGVWSSPIRCWTPCYRLRYPWSSSLPNMSIGQLLWLQRDGHWSTVPGCPDVSGETFGSTLWFRYKSVGDACAVCSEGYSSGRNGTHEQGNMNKCKRKLKKFDFSMFLFL